MNNIRRFVAVAVAATLSGCFSMTTGRKFNDNSVKDIHTGKTTRSEVIQMFGQPPNRTSTGNGNEIWTYIHHQAKSHATAATYIPIVGLFAGGGKTTSSMQSLTVQFAGDIVSSCAFGRMHSDIEVNGLINSQVTSGPSTNITIPCEEVGILPPALKAPSETKQL